MYYIITILILCMFFMYLNKKSTRTYEPFSNKLEQINYIDCGGRKSTIDEPITNLHCNSICPECCGLSNM